MYTVYTIPGSCSTGIVVLLEKLGVPYTAVKRENVSDYSTIVPTNQVPALKTEEGQIITEGAAIVLYLLERHRSTMLPNDISAKADFLRWLMFDYATLHPAYSKMFTANFKLEITEDVKKNVLTQLAHSTSALWAILDKELESKRFITGDHPTVIDYLATIYSSWGNYWPDIKITFGKNVERLINEVSQLPEFKAGYQKEGIEFKKAPK